MAEPKKTLAYPTDEINNLLSNVKSSATIARTVTSEVKGRGDSLIDETAAFAMQSEMYVDIVNLTDKFYVADFYVGDIIAGGQFNCNKSKLITAASSNKIVLIPNSASDSGYAVASVSLHSKITIVFISRQYYFRIYTSSDVDYIKPEEISKFDLTDLTTMTSDIGGIIAKLENIKSEATGLVINVEGKLNTLDSLPLPSLMTLVSDIKTLGGGIISALNERTNLLSDNLMATTDMVGNVKPYIVKEFTLGDLSTAAYYGNVIDLSDSPLYDELAEAIRSGKAIYLKRDDANAGLIEVSTMVSKEGSMLVFNPNIKVFSDGYWYSVNVGRSTATVSRTEYAEYSDIPTAATNPILGVGLSRIIESADFTNVPYVGAVQEAINAIKTSLQGSINSLMLRVLALESSGRPITPIDEGE